MLAADALDVCDTSAISKAQNVNVRGTGYFGRDGLVIGDATCPMAGSGPVLIPALILINVAKYTSPELKAKYQSKEETAPRRALFQLLARGKLDCKSKLRFAYNNSGEIVSGDGYGFDGFIRCELREAQLMVFEELLVGIEP